MGGGILEYDRGKVPKQPDLKPSKCASTVQYEQNMQNMHPRTYEVSTQTQNFNHQNTWEST